MKESSPNCTSRFTALSLAEFRSITTIVIGRCQSFPELAGSKRSTLTTKYSFAGQNIAAVSILGKNKAQ